MFSILSSRAEKRSKLSNFSSSSTERAYLGIRTLGRGWLLAAVGGMV